MKLAPLVSILVLLPLIALISHAEADASEVQETRSTVRVLETKLANGDPGFKMRVLTLPSPPGKEWDVFLPLRDCRNADRSYKQACAAYNASLRAVRVDDEIKIYRMCDSGLGIDHKVHGGCGSWIVQRFAASTR